MRTLEQQLQNIYPYGHPLFTTLTLDELDLHSQKNHDYAGGGDPLGNFKRVSAMLKLWGFDIPPALVALIYLLKQLDAAMWLTGQQRDGDVESVDARLADIHVYAKLVRILLTEAASKSVAPDTVVHQPCTGEACYCGTEGAGCAGPEGVCSRTYPCTGVL